MAVHRRTHPNGDTYCNACKSLRYDKFRKDPANAEKISTYSRHSRLRTTYGIEPEEFSALLRSQNGRCAICETNKWGSRRPHVDHNHETGRVRGILCHGCNTALGLLKDNPDIIIRAAAYLRK